MDPLSFYTPKQLSIVKMSDLLEIANLTIASASVLLLTLLIITLRRLVPAIITKFSRAVNLPSIAQGVQNVAQAAKTGGKVDLDSIAAELGTDPGTLKSLAQQYLPALAGTAQTGQANEGQARIAPNPIAGIIGKLITGEKMGTRDLAGALPQVMNFFRGAQQQASVTSGERW